MYPYRRRSIKRFFNVSQQRSVSVEFWNLTWVQVYTLMLHWTIIKHKLSQYLYAAASQRAHTHITNTWDTWRIITAVLVCAKACITNIYTTHWWDGHLQTLFSTVLIASARDSSSSEPGSNCRAARDKSARYIACDLNGDRSYNDHHHGRHRVRWALRRGSARAPLEIRFKKELDTHRSRNVCAGVRCWCESIAAYTYASTTYNEITQKKQTYNNMTE